MMEVVLFDVSLYIYILVLLLVAYDCVLLLLLFSVNGVMSNLTLCHTHLLFNTPLLSYWSSLAGLCVCTTRRDVDEMICSRWPLPTNQATNCSIYQKCESKTKQGRASLSLYQVVDIDSGREST